MGPGFVFGGNRALANGTGRLWFGAETGPAREIIAAVRPGRETVEDGCSAGPPAVGASVPDLSSKLGCPRRSGGCCGSSGRHPQRRSPGAATANPGHPTRTSVGEFEDAAVERKIARWDGRGPKPPTSTNIRVSDFSGGTVSRDGAGPAPGATSPDGGGAVRQVGGRRFGFPPNGDGRDTRKDSDGWIGRGSRYGACAQPRLESLPTGKLANALAVWAHLGEAGAAPVNGHLGSDADGSGCHGYGGDVPKKGHVRRGCGAEGGKGAANGRLPSWVASSGPCGRFRTGRTLVPWWLGDWSKGGPAMLPFFFFGGPPPAPAIPGPRPFPPVFSPPRQALYPTGAAGLVRGVPQYRCVFKKRLEFSRKTRKKTEKRVGCIKPGQRFQNQQPEGSRYPSAPLTPRACGGRRAEG